MHRLNLLPQRDRVAKQMAECSPVHAGRAIRAILGRIGLTIVVRVLGLILCALAVQFMVGCEASVCW